MRALKKSHGWTTARRSVLHGLTSVPMLPFLTRRHMLGGFATAGACLLAGTLPLRAATESGTVAVDQLMAAQALPDMWLGSADAPVTIIEYASMTCTHCAAFHAETWPTLKTKYINAGKVRFVLREFPLDVLAGAGFMLARCAGPDKRNALVDLLFTQQQNWAFVDKPLEALASTVRQAGLSQAAFDSCLTNTSLLDQVNAVRDRAAKDFGVNATPTFFINGRRVAGELTVSELENQLQPLLAKG